MIKKRPIYRVLAGFCWTLLGAATVMLLVAAIQKKDAQQCSGIDINIKGVSNNFFVDKNDILQMVATVCDGHPEGKSIGSIDLGQLEQLLETNTWVREAQLFFDNNERLQVNVVEREPVVRVFTSSGTTFYIDSACAILPLSEKFSARLPVFTNFPSDKKVLAKADSILLNDVLNLSLAIQQDPFHMAMIEQVDITPQRTFEMIPKLGNTIIAFGSAKNIQEKLDKLQLFYQQVVVKAGWNKYSEINVQYTNQVVAKRKGAEEVKEDSLRTLQLMKVIAENAERMAADTLQVLAQDNEHNTTNKSIIQQSMERDDNSSSIAPVPEDISKQAVVIAEPASVPVATSSTEGVESRPATTKPQAANDAIIKNLKPVSKPTIKNPAVTGNTKPATAVKKTPQAPAKKAIAPGEKKKPKMVMPKPIPKSAAPAKTTNEY